MPDKVKNHIAFCLCPGFPLFCVSSALEVLRHANRFASKPHYTWSLLSDTGDPVRSSSGVSMVPDADIDEFPSADRVIVIAGLEPANLDQPNVVRYLRSQASTNAELGGVSNGAFLLAEQKLLDGHAATVHWEDFPAFCVMYPDVLARYQRYVIDRKRLTCSGGTSTLDLFLEIVRRDLGNEVALLASRQLLFHRQDGPESTVAFASDTRRYSYRVQRALSIIGSGAADRLNVSTLAEQVGLSRRQLLRLFRREIGETPLQVLMRRRLERSHSLITNSHLPLAVVATAVGFSSQSHLTSAYKRHYGVTPAEQRRRQIGSTQV